MKKIGLLLASMVLLSGCTPTNGILNQKDLNDGSIQVNYKEIESLLEEQKNVEYVPDEIKEFVSKTKTEDQINSGTGYLDLSLQDMSNMHPSSFMYNVHYGGGVDKNTKAEFEKLVGILDESISKGIKFYLDTNMEADINKEGIYTKIGRVWVYISPITNRDAYGYTDDEITKNEVTLMIKVKDIKDEKYKQIVNSLAGEDLIVDSINVGKHQDLIQLSNMESKLYDDYIHDLENPAIKYQLFMKDKEINKVRIFISSKTNKNINDDLVSLNRLSDILEFDLEDTKQLEEMKMIIQKNKTGKKTLSSENFNFDYRNFEHERSAYGNLEKIGITELVIEKRK